ncbi:MAG: YbaB/EbfC family nucleoid-associated protein [bacterium]
MNIAKLMKQAQKMQGDLQRVQAELATRLYEGSAGGGAVKAVCSGDGELKSVKISPELLKEADVEMLQDLIVTAVREASSKAKEEMQREMGSLTGGMGLPPGMGF